MSDLKKKRKLRAAIYARTSADDKDLSKDKKKSSSRRALRQSIDEQVNACLEDCKRNGYIIDQEIDVYCDPDFSGRTYPEGFAKDDDKAFEAYFNERIHRKNKKYRPALGKLLSRAKDYDIILVRDIYRLLRPAFRSYLDDHLWQFFSEQSIQIHSLEDGTINSNKFEDLMITNLKLQIADQAKRQEAEAAKRSLKALKDDGKLASGVKCYGFEPSQIEAQKAIPVKSEMKTVRFIFDKYIEGNSVLEITRLLNLDQKTHVPWVKSRKNPESEPQRKWKEDWNSKIVRNILLRPYYAGLQFNSEGVIIKSKVFPQEPDSIITIDEYYSVRAMFTAREEKEEKRNKQGGSSAGTQRTRYKGKIKKEKPVIHILSGLLKCGVCGKSLYISQTSNPYYGKKPVKVYAYICRTPQEVETKITKNSCHKVRILEEYPLEAINQVESPTGNGLVDALFPLLFRGYILQYEKETSPISTLQSKKDVLGVRFEELKSVEKRAFAKLIDGPMSDEQFDSIMEGYRKERETLKQQLAELDAQIKTTTLAGITVPKDKFIVPGKVSRETLRDLALMTFKEIIVYPLKIIVVMKDGHWFEIDRLKRQNSRILPFWKARISTEHLTSDTQIGIAYYYKSTDKNLYSPVTTLYADEHMEILTLGSNDSIDAHRYDLRTESTRLSTMLKKTFGESPGYKRELEINSQAFFGGEIKDMDKIRRV